MIYYLKGCVKWTYTLIMDNILDKTEQMLRLRNYSPKTRKAYLLYIKDYITFSKKFGVINGLSKRSSADVAQLAEQCFRKAKVVGSNPTIGSNASRAGGSESFISPIKKSAR